jgi:hypothetical protein
LEVGSMVNVRGARPAAAFSKGSAAMLIKLPDPTQVYHPGRFRGRPLGKLWPAYV